MSQVTKFRYDQLVSHTFQRLFLQITVWVVLLKQLNKRLSHFSCQHVNITYRGAELSCTTIKSETPFALHLLTVIISNVASNECIVWRTGSSVIDGNLWSGCNRTETNRLGYYLFICVPERGVNLLSAFIPVTIVLHQWET